MKQARHVNIFDIPGLSGYFVSSVDADVIPGNDVTVDFTISLVVLLVGKFTAKARRSQSLFV